MKHALFRVALLALAGCVLPPSRIAVRGVPNFHRVNAGLYRSAQPDTAGIQALAAHGVKTIINLRMADEAWAGEATVARSHGIGTSTFRFAASADQPQPKRRKYSPLSPRRRLPSLSTAGGARTAQAP